ncbi:hypothetical protein [Aureimonas sp. SK2]|uniref:hypothetical protein n=1 Tax=Aureimonas sp. SK2 TaxID=3015992 RepID=UPI002444C83C|nr:hypothetical protein [Aureimonas sp. SK2]
MAFLQRGRRGPVFMIDEAALADIYRLALRFLVVWRCDGNEALEALRKRVTELSASRQMETLKSREAWAEADRLRAAEGVTP